MIVTSARTDGLEAANVNLIDTGADDIVAAMSRPVHKGQEQEGVDVAEMQESDVQALHNSKSEEWAVVNRATTTAV